MKICIYGAGSIGGFLAGRLAQAGETVSLIARGEHGLALREQGLTLITERGEHNFKIPVSPNPTDFGMQDVVIVATKSHAIPDVSEQIKPLLGAHTAVLFAINGFPWWYFHHLPGEWENWQLKSLDPQGLIWKHVGPERALGCAVYLAAEIVRPGVIRSLDGPEDRLLVGDPSDPHSARCKALCDALSNAGFHTQMRDDIRYDIWHKLWGNIAFNPISALTHASMGAIAGDPVVKQLVRNVMYEAEAVANRLGIAFGITVDQRIEKASLLGMHKTSMLQDIEKGRHTEKDGIIGAVQEVAQRLNIATPTIDALYTLLYQKEQFFGGDQNRNVLRQMESAG